MKQKDTQKSPNAKKKKLINSPLHNIKDKYYHSLLITAAKQIEIHRVTKTQNNH